jgi:endonuclease/exonuclease/phosphatase family metal-dependent hydrolase
MQHSKSWGSLGARTATIALFAVRNNTHRVEILHVNTHLDVAVEEARREQARLLRTHIDSWRRRHAQATVFVTGDFNCAPGHKAHEELTLNGGLSDAWLACADAVCACNRVSVSFHGWLGSVVDVLPARLVVYLLFVVHAMGFGLPLTIPDSVGEGASRFIVRSMHLLLSAALSVAFDYRRWVFKFSIFEAVPMSLSHLHVDWILSSRENVTPLVMCVGDVRATNFSSDHFPIIGLFELK